MYFFLNGTKLSILKTTNVKGIPGNKLIRPIILEEILTGPVSMDLLQNRILLTTDGIAQENSNEFSSNGRFQQDGISFKSVMRSLRITLLVP